MVKTGGDFVSLVLLSVFLLGLILASLKKETDTIKAARALRS